MSLPIRPDPDIPEAIIEAARAGSLAVFIGAGVSRLTGCWSWHRLAQTIVDRCWERDLITFREAESLKTYSDNRKVLTICRRLLDDQNAMDLFYTTIDEALKGEEDLPISKIYEEIRKIPALFVTTNYDAHFDVNFHRNHVSHGDPSWPAEVGQGRLLHIHGRVEDPNSLVVTLRQYMNLYGNKSFRQLMHEVFSKHRVLFIGYGLTELEVIEQLVRESDGNTMRHWILEGFFTGEERLFEIECKYYGDLGIEMIPYAKDQRGYDQLYFVIKEWARRINQTVNESLVLKERLDRLIDAVDRT